MSLFELCDANGNKHRTRSGTILPYKINCDALIGRDLDCLAAIIALRTPAFKAVVPVPTGGNLLAGALERYRNPVSERVLIVDDVLTTGESMAMARRCVAASHFGILDFNEQVMPVWPRQIDLIDGFVIFNRSGIEFPWIRAVFNLTGDWQRSR